MEISIPDELTRNKKSISPMKQHAVTVILGFSAASAKKTYSHPKSDSGQN